MGTSYMETRQISYGGGGGGGGGGGLAHAIDQHPYQGVRRTPTPPLLHKLWQRPRFHLFS